MFFILRTEFHASTTVGGTHRPAHYRVVFRFYEYSMLFRLYYHRWIFAGGLMHPEENAEEHNHRYYDQYTCKKPPFHRYPPGVLLQPTLHHIHANRKCHYIGCKGNNEIFPKKQKQNFIHSCTVYFANSNFFPSLVAG